MQRPARSERASGQRMVDQATVPEPGAARLSAAPGEPRPVTAVELQKVLRAERGAIPFFVYRAADGDLRIVSFAPECRQLTIGRASGADVSIGWDEQVSSVHAVIDRLAGEVVLLDDGLSRNGSYVNGQRVRGARRLSDRDLIRVGRTAIVVRNPRDTGRNQTITAPDPLMAPSFSAQQRRVLAVLCRPARDGSGLATPSTNQEIAAELHLSVAAVKVHLRAMFEKFGIGRLPQNKKRLALVQLALASGALGEIDLESS
jgi:FHA domain/Bacterial regulatory proteins, luxR family